MNARRLAHASLALGTALLGLAACSKPAATGGVEPIPTAPPTPTASATTPTGPLPCSAEEQAALTSILDSRAGTEAMKHEREGGMLCGRLPDGGELPGPAFLMQPDQCYVVLAQGLPATEEIDVTLTIDVLGGGPATAGLPSWPIASDLDAGNRATLGAGQCLRLAGAQKGPLPMNFPVPVKVTLKARHGAGPIAAQVYRKPAPK